MQTRVAFPFFKFAVVLIVLSFNIGAVILPTVAANSLTLRISLATLSARQVPVGIPPPNRRGRTPNRSTLRANKIRLGQALFFDKRLSANGTISCGTCHDPAMAFVSSESIAVGNETGTRNAPTILNSVFAKSYFWDGRVNTLEDQARQPLLNVAEMGMISEAVLVRRLSSITEYQNQFKKVFRQEGISLQTIAAAIAAYERTLVSSNSAFDRYIKGDARALTDLQKRGWELFKGKAKCIECHAYSRSSPFFTDSLFHNTGVGTDSATLTLLEHRAQTLSGSLDANEIGLLAHTSGYSQLGRFLVTRRLEDLAAFKTPTLRDVELTRPYMHDGSFDTLLDVVRFYNRGGVNNRMLDKKIGQLELSEQEMSELVEFMRALTSDDVLKLTQSSQPQTREKVLLPGKR